MRCRGAWNPGTLRQRISVLTSVHRNSRSGSLEAPVLYRLLYWLAIGPDFRLTGLTIDCRMSTFGPSACEWCLCYKFNDMRCGHSLMCTISMHFCAVLTFRQIQMKPEVCHPGFLYSSPRMYSYAPSCHRISSEQPLLVCSRFYRYGPSGSAGLWTTTEACSFFPFPAFPAPPVNELDDKVAPSAQMKRAARPR